MSIALGVDPAFVSTHHLYRVILLVVLAPLFYRLYRRLYDRWRDQL
ncbi:MAG: AbrB family transcriptional regulator, partial [Rhodospirillales bacterium]|nr:AbrB family transcriptional regulator [Rhodospirillales bacterium]